MSGNNTHSEYRELKLIFLLFSGGSKMATSLTGIGTLWAGLSLLASILCCAGFYLPFWLQVSSGRLFQLAPHSQVR